ncbi:hypothetical protein [Streptomyces chiangmaiensis]|uniref:Integral membrane protein n=1 Tax=Streptomyces chiangmaiensis TaxID=766497 RepID=A0ABU7F8F8_9ACTN|nr:hypothetical protein [Streptomyces chiangmaiensis]MED7820485.1 hypothetical protein [Streptomyces chiangmaiensis]
MDISGTQLRAVRAALFTTMVVTLSTASHVLLSEVPLPMGTVAVIAGAVFVVSYALAGRERGFRKIAALLVPLELTADTVFTAGQHACYGRVGGPVTGPLRSVGLDVLCSGGTLATPLTRVTGTGSDRVAALLTHADPATAWILLAAHVSVGLFAASWLRRGERALADLLRAAAATTFRPLLVAVAAVAVRLSPSCRAPRPVHRAATTRTHLFVHSLGRRGPPRSVAFA